MKQEDEGRDTRAGEIREAKTEATDRILTVPNAISLARLCMVPLFLWLLLRGHDVAAAATFAVAAGTDFVDGQVARRTNSVSKLGQLLDPCVDRALMVSGVVGVYLVGRIPLWMVVLVVARDLLMVAGGLFLMLRRRGDRVPVVFAGKVATTLLFSGFALLLVNWPPVPGLGIAEIAWLPGFGHGSASLGIWLVYAGIGISACTTVHYIRSGLALVRRA